MELTLQGVNLHEPHMRLAVANHGCYPCLAPYRLFVLLREDGGLQDYRRRLAGDLDLNPHSLAIAKDLGDGIDLDAHGVGLLGSRHTPRQGGRQQRHHDQQTDAPHRSTFFPARFPRRVFPFHRKYDATIRSVARTSENTPYRKVGE
jgi:hypothetical protein